MNSKFFDFGTQSHREQLYKEYETRSTYIIMRDGIKIAVDFHVPLNLPQNKKIPAILVQTRYWRVFKFRKIFNWLEKLLNSRDYRKEFTINGFAVIDIDVRGSGASFGSRPYPWSEKEIRDSFDVIEWIISQPWSDGNVFTWGNSYTGTTAEMVGAVNHPAVKGLIIMHNEFDPYLDIAFPGGIFNEAFVNEWANANNCLDHNNLRGLGLLAWLLIKKIGPIDSDKNNMLLKEAIRQHSFNIDVAKMAEKIVFRDDNWDNTASIMKNFSVFRYREEIEKSNIPMFCWGSWMDAATANTTIERFLNYKNPMIAVIGAWTHGALWHASPYLPPKKTEPNPPLKIQINEWIRFYDACLEKKISSEKIIFYYTMGEEKWKKTTKWPPTDHNKQKWYLSTNNSLTTIKPQDESGVDNYLINFNVSTGKKNRWMTEMAGDPVIYSDRIKQDKKMLIYTSNPLEEDLEITGYPIVHLYMTSTHEDGAIFVYLEEIEENGNVIYITEGQLRVIHRKISSETPQYQIKVPYHSFKKKDAFPMVPNEVAKISFGLLPTSVLIRKGHRIRIAIAGADKDTFVRIPKVGTPNIAIARNENHASFIELPIINRK